MDEVHMLEMSTKTAVLKYHQSSSTRGYKTRNQRGKRATSSAHVEGKSTCSESSKRCANLEERPQMNACQDRRCG
jgi:hypothetical protein